jgi:Cu/Ag efflux pump CusA
MEGFYGLFYGINLSVAVAVGFIALFGLAIRNSHVDYHLPQ